MLAVAVVVGEPGERGADLVQLYPREEGKVRGRDAVLLRDGRAGRDVSSTCPGRRRTRRTSSARRRRRVASMLAGGLGPENVRAAIEAVRPWAVDASSRLERRPA